MILLILNRRDFEYDIYSLIKAFYVGSEIRVFDAWEDLPDSSAAPMQKGGCAATTQPAAEEAQKKIAYL